MPFAPTDPNAQLFSFIPQARAQNLAQRSGDPTVDALNQIHLGMLSRQGGGTQEYLKALAAGNQLGADTARYESDNDRGGKTDVAYLQNVKDFGDFRHAIHPGAKTDLGLDMNVMADSAAQANMDAINARMGVSAKAASDLSNAGQSLDPQWIANNATGMGANPKVAPKPMTKTGYITEFEQGTLDNDAVKAQAALTNANRPRDESDGNGSWQITYGPDGTETGRVWRSSSGAEAPPPAGQVGVTPNSPRFRFDQIANFRDPSLRVTVSGNIATVTDAKTGQTVGRYQKDQRGMAVPIG